MCQFTLFNDKVCFLLLGFAELDTQSFINYRFCEYFLPAFLFVITICSIAIFAFFIKEGKGNKNNNYHSDLDDELVMDIDKLSLDELSLELEIDEDKFNLELEDDMNLDDFFDLEEDLDLHEELDLEFTSRLIDFDAEIPVLSNDKKDDLIKRLDFVAKEIGEIKLILIRNNEDNIDLTKNVEII